MKGVRRAVWPFVGSVALVAALLLGVLPTRSWLDQRDRIQAEEAKLQVLTRENRRLASRVQELHTDAEIERLAREQYNLVRPGEEAYAILPAPGSAEPAPKKSRAAPTSDKEPSLLARIGDTLTFWD